MSENKLLEEFNKFTEKIDWDKHGWYKSLKIVCEFIKELKNEISKEEKIENIEDFEKILSKVSNEMNLEIKDLDSFLLKYIYENDNGVSNASQGTIRKTELNPHKQIIDARIKENIKLLIDILKEKDFKKIYELIEKTLEIENRNYYVLKYRLLLTMCPENMTSLVSTGKFWTLINNLKRVYGIEDMPKNYLEVNQWLIKKLESSKEDVYKKQVFYWELNILLAKEIIEEEKNQNNMKEKEVMEIEEIGEKMNLNRVLYGPPGTGKTYNTINEALKIVDIKFYEENKDNRKALKEKFEEYKSSGQIEMVTFHQNYGYEDFIEGIKATTNEEEGIEYSIEDGIFKRISDIAKENFIKSSKEKIEKLDFKIVFEENILKKMDEKEALEIKTSKSYFNITEITDKSIRFDKANGESKHSLSIRTLKKIYEENKIHTKGGLVGYYKGILNLLNENRDKIITKEKRKPYVLIIDEINRGNISKIFGELITLVEDNKRLGNSEGLEVTLPYSKDKFGIPNNLHILGTMNTADRSIALMDTALRRRFEFIEMMPNIKSLEEIEVGETEIDLSSFLEIINKRIEFLYDREHTIGHAYFIDVKTKEELDNIMRNKVIPLLQEYFYEDWEKVQIVLGDHKKQGKNEEDKFVGVECLKEKSILGFDYDETEDEVMSYKVKDEFTVEAYKIYEEIDE